MKVEAYDLQPPGLHEIAVVVEKALQANYASASVTVGNCPDLRNEPFYLASRGLSGGECIADIGGQPNLFPVPKLSARYSIMSIAQEMGMSGQSGMLIGAGAGPFFDIGVNNELAPNIAWKLEEGQTEPVVTNLTHYTRIDNDGKALCQVAPTTNCALMMNLYGSDGSEGPVLRMKARKNIGGKSFTDCIRLGLQDHFGSEKPISIGGVFAIKRGTAYFHVMPDFPPEDQLPFRNAEQINNWLTWHNFDAPMACLTVMHTCDPAERVGKKLGLRMEHTHCFAKHRTDQGGHYHTDIQGEGIEEVEYEGYFNTAKTLYRIDQPETVLKRGLRDR